MSNEPIPLRLAAEVDEPRVLTRKRERIAAAAIKRTHGMPRKNAPKASHHYNIDLTDTLQLFVEPEHRLSHVHGALTGSVATPLGFSGMDIVLTSSTRQTLCGVKSFRVAGK
jgi:hypothetical protein